MRALEAAMDGFEVLPMERAAEIGDIFCTATGDKNVITRAHMERMKDGAILANTGHFNVEIEIPALPRRSPSRRARRARSSTSSRSPTAGGSTCIGDGRLVNLAAAEGHPAIVMDMSFANQALSAEWVVANGATLERKVYDVPKEIDDEIARLKLATMGIDDRPADRGAGEVPRLVGRGDVSRRRGRAPLGPCSPVTSSLRSAIVRLEDGRGRRSSTSGGCPTRRSSSGCESAAEVADAIRTLAVRGAPAIGVAAAYGYALAAARGEDLDAAYDVLAAARPTAVNLRWALDEMRDDPTAGARAGDPRGRGRALPAHGGARGRPRRSRARAS